VFLLSVGARDSSLLHSVQNGSGAHPSFHPVGIWDSFSHGKATGGVKLTDHSPPSTVKVTNALGRAWTPRYVLILWCLIKHTYNITFVAYFPKVGLCDPHAVCVSVIPPINFYMSESISMKLGMFIMAPEHISTAYFINPSHQSVCLYV
jgi:hypothetical protein